MNVRLYKIFQWRSREVMLCVHSMTHFDCVPRSTACMRSCPARAVFNKKVLSIPSSPGKHRTGMLWFYALAILFASASTGLAHVEISEISSQDGQDGFVEDDECQNGQNGQNGQNADGSSGCALHALQLRRNASNDTSETTLEAGLGWVKTLYHQTTPSAGKSILKNGFRLGHVGWCGAGIYFATSVQATSGKIKGPDSGAGFIIEAKVNLGRIKHMPWHCTTSATCNHHPYAKCQDRKARGSWLKAQGYDSINFQPDPYGPEYVIYNPDRVVSMKGYYLHDHHHHWDNLRQLLNLEQFPAQCGKGHPIRNARQSQWRMKKSPHKGCTPLPSMFAKQFPLAFYHWIRPSNWFHFTIDAKVFQTWCNLEWLCTSPLCKLIGCMHHFLCGDILVAKMCRYRHQRFDALRVRPIQGQDWRWAIGQGGILALYPKYWWNTPRSQLLGMERVLIQFHARGPLKFIVSLWKTGALRDNVWHVLLLSFWRSFILLKCYLVVMLYVERNETNGIPNQRVVVQCSRWL